MSRRSTPQQKIDDAAFPIRLRIKVPGGGLGRALDDAYAWLEKNAGRGGYAVHANSNVMVGDAIAIHFRALDHAQAFLQAFSTFELADGTESSVYSSPMR